MAFDISKSLNLLNDFIFSSTSDMIAKYMILYNKIAAEKLIANKHGILRIHHCKLSKNKLVANVHNKIEIKLLNHF